MATIKRLWWSACSFSNGTDGNAGREREAAGSHRGSCLWTAAAASEWESHGHGTGVPLKEQASSSTRPVVSTDPREHRAARDKAAPAAGRKKQPQQQPQQLLERPGVIWVGATPELDTQQAMYASWRHWKVTQTGDHFMLSRREHSSPVEFLPTGLQNSSNFYPKAMKIGDAFTAFTTGALFTSRVFVERVAKLPIFFGQRTDAMIQN